MTLRIATRRSPLARAQAAQVAEVLRQRTGSAAEVVPMRATADEHPERLVADLGTKEVFIDRLREAVLAGDCDLAVHSAKDLPAEQPDELVVAAVPRREDPRDVLVTRAGVALSGLDPIATVGTSSPRRRVQLLRAKPGLQVLDLRGNVGTRMQRVADGELDAVVVALAGLRRLHRPVEEGGVGPLELPLSGAPLEPGEMLPAPGQGALALECRADDDDARAACRTVAHRPSQQQLAAERAFAARLGTGCTAPVGALARQVPPRGVEVLGMVGHPGRRRVLRRSHAGRADRPAEAGRELAEQMLEAGAAELIADVADGEEA